MQKLIFISLTILFFGCNNEQTISLNNDPIINDCFNNNEIQDLTEILRFFENQIAIPTDSKSIIDSYESFFENLKPETELENIDINISFEDQEKFFSGLDPYLFNEIWYYDKVFNPRKKDTVESIHYNRNGKYLEFLIAVSQKDKSIEEYFEDFTSGGDISPEVLAYSMLDFKKYDLNSERIRLIIAINYLTYNELLRLMENQKKE